MVLIDEFGKGTADGDGVGLFAALISWLAMNGTPRTIAITHFHELFTKNLIDHDSVQWCNMSVHYGEESKEQFECFLYRLENGPCTQSHGLYCAQLAALPSSIIERGTMDAINLGTRFYVFLLAAKLRGMYEADVAPEDLRFASLDPNAEQEAIELVQKYFY